jgi:hypothetical protein
MSSDWLIQGTLLYHFFVCFPLTAHRRGMFSLEFRIVSTTQLYQFIGQCRSCYTLGFSIEETLIVGTTLTAIKQQHRVLGLLPIIIPACKSLNRCLN